MITGTANIAVTVSDMSESIRFYTQALGLHNAFEFRHPDNGAPSIVYLRVRQGQFIELFYGGMEENPWNDTMIGFNHLCFEADDMQPAVETVRDAGSSIDSGPEQGVDRNWQAWVKDPNGVRIELMQIMSDSPQSRFR